MMRSFGSLLVSLLSLSALSFAKSSSGDSVLVILEDKIQKDSYSIFFDGLKERGYDLTFRAPKDVSPVMLEDGYPKFSNVIVFAPNTKNYAVDITPQNFVTLLGSNTNVLFALSDKQTPLMSLATEFSLILPPPGTPLLSHFPKRDEPADVIPIPVDSSKSPILTPGLAPVWFKGIPHSYGSNPYLVPILSAPAESFAADSTSDSGADAVFEASEKAGEGLWAGSSLGVATGFQASTNARALWVGGIEVFSDEFANKEVSKGVKSGNKQFALDVAAWTFQESLVLRIDNTSHWAVSDHTPKEMYTTNENIHFGVQISSYNPVTGRWRPYSGLNDLQLEFTMLDPHIRTALKHKAGSPEGTYEVDFRAPDRHGVFKFVIDYKRKGYTHLSSSTVVPVVPPRHDGYPRFLSAAWPYYTGAISTSVAFLLFSAIWLGGGPVELIRKKTTKIE